MTTPLPEGSEKPRAVRAMFDRIAGRYDLVNRLMTLGMDVGWRRRTAGALGLPRGSLVLDLACGTGDLCRELERRGYGAVGFDFSAGMLAEAKTTVPLVQADVLRLPLGSGVADGVTCGFALRNVADLTAFFEEVARVIRPGGRVALLEVAEPANPLMRIGHRMYFRRVVPLLGGLLSDREAYRYLPRSTAYLPPAPRLLEMLAEAGFGAPRRRPLSGGIAQVLVATREDV